MKRIFAVVLVLAICLCGCAVKEAAPTTVAEACQVADQMVAQWNSDARFGCGYSGKFDTELAGGPYYIVNARYFKSIVDESQYPEYILTCMTQDIFDELYPQLCEVFAPFDVCVMITLADDNGKNTYSGIIDGEITYFD